MPWFNKDKKKTRDRYHFEGILEEENRKKFKNSMIAYRRMIILIGLITVCVVVLIGRMAYLTINQYTFYSSKLISYNTQILTSSVPRGSIYDRNGVELVSTQANLTIMYYPSQSTTSETELSMAKAFTNVVDIDISSLTTRDKQDYLILYESQIAQSVITDEEWEEYNAGELSDNDIYLLQLDRITDELIDETWTEDELKMYHVYYLMNKNSSEPNTVAEGVSEEEASYIAEHSDIFNGFYVSYSYERVYNYDSFKQIFGKVSTSTQGIPAEDSSRLLALGYQMTSSVGTSGLEKQYEELLSGTANEYTIEYDDDGNAVMTEVTSGTKGYNLTLAIDWDLQQYLEERVEYYILSLIDYPNNKYFNSIFITMMDPYTGDIVAMVGKQYDRDTGEFIDYPEGNYLTSYAMGSAVKGATLYSAYKYGVVSVGEVMDDEAIKIANTNEKASWRYLGYVNDVQALAYSSNVYMMHLAIRIGEGNYQYNQPLSINVEAFKKMRESFGELGLGVLTGIDIPDEEVGTKGASQQSGLLLDFAIGQYDNYTVVQLAQYVSTIANGGKRIKPRLVLDAFYTENGEKVVVYTNEVEVLDDVSDQTTAFERIQLGFQGTTTYGTVAGVLDSSLKIAGKTGTAEVYTNENGVDVNYDNRSFVAYAPYDNPRIAYACVAPRQETVDNVSACITLAGEAIAYYNELYPEE